MKYSHHCSISLFSWLNSRHMKRPPGFSTLYASSNTLSMCVTFLMPKAIVYAVKEASSIGSFSASAWSQSICLLLKPNFSARDRPTSSMASFMSHTVTLPLIFPAMCIYFRNLNAMSPAIKGPEFRIMSRCSTSHLAIDNLVVLVLGVISFRASRVASIHLWWSLHSAYMNNARLLLSTLCQP